MGLRSVRTKIKTAALCVSVGAFALLVSRPALAAQTAEEILAQAARYTVRISAQTTIGFNQDDGVSSRGAGFLIDRDRGWVLTNAHVATRSPVVLKVAFKDADQVAATRVYVDPLLDMAIIQVDPKTIPAAAVAAELECAGLPAIGAPIAAFGHPWGLNFTATRGIVSGEPWIFPREYIQTDAILNHGNSGGPLINLNDGKIIGLNSRAYNPDPTDEKFSSTISLAEPVPAICRIIELLRSGQDARLKTLPLALATGDDDPRPRVARTLDPSSQFQPADLIVGVNGASGVRNASDLLTQLRGNATVANVTVERAGKTVTLTTPLRTEADILTAKYVKFAGLIIGPSWRLDDYERIPSGCPPSAPMRQIQGSC